MSYCSDLFFDYLTLESTALNSIVVMLWNQIKYSVSQIASKAKVSHTKSISGIAKYIKIQITPLHPEIYLHQTLSTEI